MRLLYGIQGTGNGHITRSIQIIKNLKKTGIDVDILVSGNTNQVNIDDNVKYKFKGFNLKYDSFGNLKRFNSLFCNNFLKFIKDISIDVSEYDKIISDYEPITAFAAKLRNREVYGISNQYSFLSEKIPRPEKKRNIDEFILRNFAPVNFPIGIHYEKYDDFITTPIISDALRIAKIKNLGHYTVYLPNIDIKIILENLKGRKEKYHIFSSKVSSREYIDNCLIEPVNKENFFNSFISSIGVITSAGFQTTSESIFIGKKLLAVPIIGQYEQECNSLALKKLGIQVESDLSNIDSFIENNSLVKIKWEDNTSEIINKILDI